MSLAKVTTILAIVATTALAQNDGSQQTDLDRYVFSNESLAQFSWFHASEFDYTGVDAETGVGYTAHHLNVTSGDWLTEDYVGARAHWWHIMVVIVPDNLNPAYSNDGLIYVTGEYYNTGNGVPPQGATGVNLVTELATGIGMVTAALFQVPNAPIVFADDPEQRERTEDAIVAYTFRKNLENVSNPELNVYMGMVRAATRGMDALTGFTGDFLGTPVQSFTITGRSKRGWTSWLTAALNPERVRAYIPIVWDGINVAEIFHHQWRNYGGWSWAIVDYWENEVMTYLDTPEIEVVQDLIDPYRYRTRLTMPKMVITGLMDEFQMPDDEQFWWDDIPSGPTPGSSAPSQGNTKWLLKMPNAGHSLSSSYPLEVQMIGTWVSYLLNGWELPYLTWDFNESNGDVTVQTYGGDVLSAKIYYATSCNDLGRRDFRTYTLDQPCTCGAFLDGLCVQSLALWTEQELTANPDGSYTGHQDPPSDGFWSAFIVNVQLTTEHTFSDDPKHNFFTRGFANMTRETTKSFSNMTRDARWPDAPPGVLEFTSRASVVANTFPFPDCSGQNCLGELV